MVSVVVAAAANRLPKQNAMVQIDNVQLDLEYNMGVAVVVAVELVVLYSANALEKHLFPKIVTVVVLVAVVDVAVAIEKVLAERRYVSDSCHWKEIFSVHLHHQIEMVICLY